MENATKALLIAASVLIVIVLIAVGVLLLGKTSDTSKQAGMVGNSIGTAVGEASKDVLGELKRANMTKDEFNSFIANCLNEQFVVSIKKIKDMKKSELGKFFDVVGYVYMNEYEMNYFDENIHKQVEKNYENNYEIYFDERKTEFNKIEDPITITSVSNNTNEAYMHIYKKNEVGSYYHMPRWYFEYDRQGFVSKIVYVLGIFK